MCAKNIFPKLYGVDIPAEVDELLLDRKRQELGEQDLWPATVRSLGFV